ncbi:sulfurtransferase [Shewanella salipaludis]|uniref:Sulfurtransferase n=1 Tax=Shewanella salipaludis TaxID=2723052 RepID=A0A972FZT3_9GAMM|nr:sulfurtransferase [Shewanella salipaludis]NMH65702.1 sulfurtransferase [Shewanella salipaludis]
MNYPLVSTAWLEAHLQDEKLVLLDASMDTVIGKEPLIYDRLVCIPGARRFELERQFCDLQSSQIHALPTEAQFSLGIQALGIAPDSLVVIYDNQGIYASPRAWWTFRVMGFDNVFVLDGGLPQWLAEGRKTVNEYQAVDETAKGNAVGHYRPQLVCDSAEVLRRLDDAGTAIFDARGAARFQGKAPEPRAGVRSGHIPHSHNLPFTEVLDGYRLRPVAELRRRFAELSGDDADTGKRCICSCGSGITACILILALEAAGYDHAVLYDGSWADWGSNHALPLETDLGK